MVLYGSQKKEYRRNLRNIAQRNVVLGIASNHDVILHVFRWIRLFVKRSSEEFQRRFDETLSIRFFIIENYFQELLMLLHFIKFKNRREKFLFFCVQWDFWLHWGPLSLILYYAFTMALVSFPTKLRMFQIQFIQVKRFLRSSFSVCFSIYLNRQYLKSPTLT